MTTWEEAGRLMDDVILRVAIGDIEAVHTPKNLDLQPELYRLQDTLPVAQPTSPHDIANIARMLELAFQLGHWWGRMDATRPEPPITHDLGGES